MWLETLLEKILSIFPQLLILRLDEGGFRTRPKLFGGTKTIPLNPGKWYFVWPVFMEFSVCKIKTQVKDVRVQSVWTKDSFDIAIGCSIRYYVRDWVKAHLEVFDYDESLQTITLKTLCECISKRTLDEIKASMDDIKKEVLSVIRKESSGWGLWIQDFGITDIGRTKNIRLLFSEKPAALNNME
jgi:hypothetical protein